MIYFVDHLPEVVMTLASRRALNAAREQPTSSVPAPLPLRHANVYLHGVFSGCSLNSPRRRSHSVEHGEGREGRGLEKITARRRSRGSASQPGRCKVERGAGNKYFCSESRRRSRIPRGSVEGAQNPPLSCRKMELPAAGEHVFAVESIEKKRSRKVCGPKSIEGHFLQSKHADRGFIDSAQKGGWGGV